MLYYIHRDGHVYGSRITDFRIKAWFLWVWLLMPRLLFLMLRLLFLMLRLLLLRMLRLLLLIAAFVVVVVGFVVKLLLEE